MEPDEGHTPHPDVDPGAAPMQPDATSHAEAADGIPADGSPAEGSTADGSYDLGKALLLAQQVADETIADARRQAESLINRARVQPVVVDPAVASVGSGDRAVPLSAPGVDLAALISLVSSLAAAITDGLTRASDQLDRVRLETSARLGALDAELERLRLERRRLELPEPGHDR